MATADPQDISLPDVAAEAGISIRTLYRYFPTRESLFDAVGDHVVARLGLPTEIEGPDDVGRVFLESAALGATSPKLMRALLATTLGRRARSPHRRRRVAAMAGALAPVTSHLSPAEARRRVGAIVYLASLPAWMTVSEECDISAEEARLGVAWAIETLVDALRRENRRQRPDRPAAPGARRGPRSQRGRSAP
jgi:AcrR family transcriptional regulator